MFSISKCEFTQCLDQGGSGIIRNRTGEKEHQTKLTLTDPELIWNFLKMTEHES